MGNKFNSLLSHLSDSELRTRYGDDFRSSIRSRTYDFGLIVLWKLFMLFVYEKLWQISDADKEKAFQGYKSALKELKTGSLLWANNVDDDVILASLDRLYPKLDTNYIKRARAIHHQRKTAAHVSDMTHDVNSVDHFLKELLNVVSRIQEYHEVYLDNLGITDLPNEVHEFRLSPKDIDHLVGAIIDALREARNFNEATAAREKIIQVRANLSGEHIEKTLMAIQENSKVATYHQILEASGASGFIRRLYSIRNEPSDAWMNFAEYLVDELTQKAAGDRLPEYNWLFEIFGMTTFEAAKSSSESESSIDPDDLPF